MSELAASGTARAGAVEPNHAVAATLAKGSIFGLVTAAIEVAVLLILLVYKINPALPVLASAVAGVLSFAPK